MAYFPLFVPLIYWLAVVAACIYLLVLGTRLVKPSNSARKL